MVYITDHFSHYGGKQHTASEVENMVICQKQMGCATEETRVCSCLPALRCLAGGKRFRVADLKSHSWLFVLGCRVHLHAYIELKPVVGTF